MTVTASPEYATPQPAEVPVPQPPKKRPTALIVAAAVGVVAVIGATVAATIALTSGSKPAPSAAPSSSSSSKAPATMTVAGMLLLTDSPGVENLDDITCTGMHGYDDIHSGAQVVITDEKGTVVATTNLDTGKLVGSGVTRQCRFSFTATSVPMGRSFYGVQLGHRGVIQYSETDLNVGPELKLGP